MAFLAPYPIPAASNKDTPPSTGTYASLGSGAPLPCDKAKKGTTIAANKIKDFKMLIFIDMFLISF